MIKRKRDAVSVKEPHTNARCPALKTSSQLFLRHLLSGKKGSGLSWQEGEERQLRFRSRGGTVEMTLPGYNYPATMPTTATLLFSVQNEVHLSFVSDVLIPRTHATTRARK